MGSGGAPGVASGSAGSAPACGPGLAAPASSRGGAGGAARASATRAGRSAFIGGRFYSPIDAIDPLNPLTV